MTPLRQQVINYMTLRGFTESTCKVYIYQLTESNRLSPCPMRQGCALVKFVHIMNALGLAQVIEQCKLSRTLRAPPRQWQVLNYICDCPPCQIKANLGMTAVLQRYSHRIDLSNHRLLKSTPNQVTFAHHVPRAGDLFR